MCIIFFKLHTGDWLLGFMGYEIYLAIKVYSSNPGAEVHLVRENGDPYKEQCNDMIIIVTKMNFACLITNMH